MSQARNATRELRKAVLDSLLDHLSHQYQRIEQLLSPGIVLSSESSKKLHEYVDHMKEVTRLTSCLSEDHNLKSRIQVAMKRLSVIRSEVSRFCESSHMSYFNKYLTFLPIPYVRS